MYIEHEVVCFLACMEILVVIGSNARNTDVNLVLLCTM